MQQKQQELVAGDLGEMRVAYGANHSRGVAITDYPIAHLGKNREATSLLHELQALLTEAAEMQVS